MKNITHHNAHIGSVHELYRLFRKLFPSFKDTMKCDQNLKFKSLFYFFFLDDTKYVSWNLVTRKWEKLSWIVSVTLFTRMPIWLIPVKKYYPRFVICFKTKCKDVEDRSEPQNRLFGIFSSPLPTHTHDKNQREIGK